MNLQELTIKALGDVSDVGYTEVSNQYKVEEQHVNPGHWAGVCQQNLKKCEHRVHCMFGYVRPGYGNRLSRED